MQNSDTSRLSYIDALKGIAIVSVLLLHTLSGGVRELIYSQIHIGQAVPVFLATTFFLSYLSLDKMDGSLRKWFYWRRISKMINRVFLPFLVVLILQSVVHLYLNDFQILTIVGGGGYGPGAYYVWIYLQIWVLLPFAYKILMKNTLLGYIFILVVCICLNVLCCNYCPDFLWRLLSVRYLFLASIAWTWYKWNEYEKGQKLALSIMGVFSLFYLLFLSNYDLSPVVYHKSWITQNYPVYFWTLIIIVLMAWGLKNAPRKVLTPLIWLGVNSWEIFLAQMFIIEFIREIPIANSPVLSEIAYVLFIFMTSIGLVWVYRLIKIT